MAGAISAHINAEGELDHLRLNSQVEGNDIAAAGARIDRLRLVGEVANLSEPKAVLDGTYHASGLDGTLALVAESKGNSDVVLPRFRLTAADAAIEGSLRIALCQLDVTVGDLDGPCSVEIIRLAAATGMLLAGSDPRRDGWALAW